MFALLPLAGAVAAVIAVPLGLIALRVRRHTFVVITIAFFFIFQLMAFNLAFTGGSIGHARAVPELGPATFNNPFYYLALAIAVGDHGALLADPGDRGSACSCGRSGTTRTGRPAWASGPCRSSSPPS